MLKIGIFLFSNDLRVADNPALAQASHEMDNLICLHCLEQPSPSSRVRAPAKI